MPDALIGFLSPGGTMVVCHESAAGGRAEPVVSDQESATAPKGRRIRFQAICNSLDGSQLMVAAIFAFLSILAFPVTASASSSSPDDPAQILAQAEERFARGVSSLTTDRAAADQALDESISLFRRLAEDHGIRNGRLFYNLGNAYLLRGDVGRAVLNYRRAGRLLPGDENVAANLAEARRRVSSRITAHAEEQALRTFVFWHYDLSPRTRFTIAAGAAALAWLLATALLVGFIRGRWWWGMVGACAMVALAFAASLYVEHRARVESPEAVVVAQDVTGRKGPDERAYQPSFTEPLGAGVELRLVERRHGWVLVRLADGRETWLPQSAIELIDESSPPSS